MDHARRLTIPLLSLVTLLGALPAIDGFADPPRRHRASYGSPSTTQAPQRTTSTIGRRASPTITRAPTQTPRSLIPPAGGGSAANVRPGFYQQLNSPKAHAGAIPHVVYVPTAPYYPYPYTVAPPSSHVVSEVPSPAPPPTPQPSQPIYVVQPASPQTPQPVYVVNPVDPRHPGASPPAESPTRTLPPAAPEPVRPVSREPVDVTYRITPEDAQVFLDDDLLGLAGDLNQGGLADTLKPGVHVLEVIHPDHRSQRLVFGVSSAEPIEVLVDLTTERVGRRSRIR